MNYEELKAKHAETEAALATANNDLKASQALADEAAAKLQESAKDVARVTSALGAAEGQITNLKSEIALRDKTIAELEGKVVSVDRAAAAKLAQVGEGAAARGRTAEPDINEETPQGLLEKFNSMSGRARTKFFRANKEKLLAAQSELVDA